MRVQLGEMERTRSESYWILRGCLVVDRARSGAEI